MDPLPVLRLAPVLVRKPWGGRRLANLGKDLPADALIGESWEVADLTAADVSGVDDPRSRVADGPFEGAALHELVQRLGTDLLGSASPTPDGRFPLLVKFLDAREHLSVQVHPHAAYVAEHPQAREKTESWYVIAAEPGAQLLVDIDDDVALDDFRAALGSSASAEMLRRVPATPGDFHHLPAGLVHAVGAGVLVAEVQTPSDSTFRIYDWTEEYGRQPRDLHLAQAADTMVTRPDDVVSAERADRPGVRTLVATEHYWIREHVAGCGPVALLDVAETRVLVVTRVPMRSMTPWRSRRSTRRPARRSKRSGRQCALWRTAAPSGRLVVPTDGGHRHHAGHGHVHRGGVRPGRRAVPCRRLRPGDRARELHPLRAGRQRLDRRRAEQDAFACDLDAGLVFVNGMVASYPQPPFGGIKSSG